nr:uncharacterized protein LOC128685745 [Cherax quadricarinatus]XP_053628336.1 uncharacterized protein LOC128685745 [Cherax quadricarinatus]XP_053628337.1 uncharacterized protein LOC128685745 [Cherax quadricarinatus]XP_053628338.1 uncharacterized protein LOC128685745 [Cherax quadricarinatus]XP_053628340.1 uncharacterized protein LOC128685745 [Cherax quadricarinatus]XP_053628341.1 uncharacterized protein LOC128685745 [Cherax quadricarinatus]
MAYSFLSVSLSLLCILYLWYCIFNFFSFPPILLLGNFNAHHHLWGGSHCNSRGDHLETLLTSYPLHVLNTGAPTHFDSHTQSLSCTDLSICYSPIALDFMWSVLPDLHDSDHFPILLTSATYTQPFRNLRWQFARADWELYSRLTTCCKDPLSSSIDELEHQFSTLFLTAATSSNPQTSGRHSQTCVPWWAPTCACTVCLKHAAYDRYRHNCTAERLLDFKQARAAACHIIHEANALVGKTACLPVPCLPLCARFGKRCRNCMVGTLQTQLPFCGLPQKLGTILSVSPEGFTSVPHFLHLNLPESNFP